MRDRITILDRLSRYESSTYNIYIQTVPAITTIIYNSFLETLPIPTFSTRESQSSMKSRQLYLSGASGSMMLVPR
jgi:hypothetical protein